MKEIASILERKMMQRSLLLKMMSLRFLTIKELLMTTKSGLSSLLNKASANGRPLSPITRNL